MAKRKKWGGLGMGLAILAVILIFGLVILPALGVYDIDIGGPAAPPATTTAVPGETTPPPGSSAWVSGDIDVTVRHYGNATAVGNSDLVAYLVPIADVPTIAGTIDVKDVGQADATGGSLTFNDCAVWQQYADLGSIQRVAGMDLAGTPYDVGTFASGICSFNDVLSYTGAEYMLYLVDDSTPADGEIGFHAQKITITNACDDCESGDHSVYPNTVYVPWLGDMGFYDSGETSRSEYLHCASSAQSDKVLRLYFMNSAAQDWTHANAVYVHVSDTNTLDYDSIVLNGETVNLIKYGDLVGDDPRYDAKPTSLSTNTSYVCDVMFDSHYVNSADKGIVELVLTYDHTGASGVNTTITWAIVSFVIAEDGYFGTNTFAHVLQYTGTSAWT